MKEEEKEDGHTWSRRQKAWSISCLDFVVDDMLQ
jgi:hypothetical protein